MASRILTNTLRNQSNCRITNSITSRKAVIRNTTKSFSSDSNSIFTRKTSKKNCPFGTLGLCQSEEDPVTYSEVKKAFLSLALKHHPDSNSNSNTDEDETNCVESVESQTKKFIKIKNAFDQIRASPNGIAILNEEEEPEMSSEEYESWFYSETGKHMNNIGELNLSKETIQEVSDMISKSADSHIGDEGYEGAMELDRSGGIWAMAKMISQDANDNASSIMGGVMRLEEGDSSKSPLKNRRRRRR